MHPEVFQECARGFISSHLLGTLVLSQMVQNKWNGLVAQTPHEKMQRELLKAPEGILTSRRWYLGSGMPCWHLKIRERATTKEHLRASCFV